jgi:protein arginine kinase activator
VKCQACDNQATVHLTHIVQGKKQVTHLCQDCAEKKEILKQQDLNLSAILQTVIGQHVGQQTDELARLTCPCCGIKYMEFKAEGRLGCPRDYDVFQQALEPLLMRIHRARRHVGKVPRQGATHKDLQAELMDLRRRLRMAVESEAYEQAAQIRDLIRQKEASG